MKTKRKLLLTGIIILTIMLVGLLFLYIQMNGTIFAKKDSVSTADFPEEYIITTPNSMEYQLFNDCAGYAVAYVLRSMGKEITGEDVYAQISNKNEDGTVEIKEVVSYLRKEGYQATMYKGSIETLKTRIAEGIPVIVFIKSSLDQNNGLVMYHYVSAVGYDNNRIFITDSAFNLTNERTDYYNRIVSIKEFEELWNINDHGSRNLYICVNT